MVGSRLLLRAASLFVSAVVAVVAGAGPAGAVTGREPIYKWLPCTEAPPGQLLTASPVGPSQRGGPHYGLSVTLRVTPCTTVTGDEVYGVAVYRPGKAYAYPSRYRDLPADRSPARSTVWVAPDTHAVCLVVHTYIRVSCLAVSWDGPGTEPVVGDHLPTDHPTVDLPAVLPYGVVNGPGCPVCWS